MNQLSIALKIVSSAVDNQAITNLIGLKPTAEYFKGQEYYTGPNHNRILKHYETNYWEYRIHKSKNTDWLQTVVDEFIRDKIFKNRYELEKLRKGCDMELSINVVFSRASSLDSFHFDHANINLLSQLNIEVDIDQRLAD